jgi:predicted DNA-binding protein YlxM (UPF0122 family)
MSEKTPRRGVKQERTLRMISGFFTDHMAGLTIPEIAAKYNVNVSTIYYYLQEIADSHGVTRDSLLEVVHSPHYMSESINKPAPHIHEEEFATRVDEVQNTLDAIKGAVKESADEIAKWPENIGGGKEL